MDSYFTLAAEYSEKRNVTVWRPSVCLSRRHTPRDSPGGSMRHGHRTLRLYNKEDEHAYCNFCFAWCTNKKQVAKYIFRIQVYCA